MGLGRPRKRPAHTNEDGGVGGGGSGGGAVLTLRPALAQNRFFLPTARCGHTTVPQEGEEQRHQSRSFALLWFDLV